jgi:hypothetical protein
MYLFCCRWGGRDAAVRVIRRNTEFCATHSDIMMWIGSTSADYPSPCILCCCRWGGRDVAVKVITWCATHCDFHQEGYHHVSCLLLTCFVFNCCRWGGRNVAVKVITWCAAHTDAHMLNPCVVPPTDPCNVQPAALGGEGVTWL